MFSHPDVLEILVVGDGDKLVNVLLVPYTAELSSDRSPGGGVEDVWWRSDARYTWSLPRGSHKLEIFCFTNKRGPHVRKKNKRLDIGSVAGVGSNFAHPDFRGCTYNEKCGPILRAPTGDALRRLQQMLHEDMHPPAADAQKGCVEYRFASATLIPHPLQLACILTCSLSCSRIGSPVSASAWGVCWRRSRVCY
jgi:hypothetical protein